MYTGFIHLVVLRLFLIGSLIHLLPASQINAHYCKQSESAMPENSRPRQASGYPVRRERLSVLEIQHFPIEINIAIESRAHLFML